MSAKGQKQTLCDCPQNVRFRGHSGQLPDNLAPFRRGFLVGAGTYFETARFALVSSFIR